MHPSSSRLDTLQSAENSSFWVNPSYPLISLTLFSSLFFAMVASRHQFHLPQFIWYLWSSTNTVISAHCLPSSVECYLCHIVMPIMSLYWHQCQFVIANNLSTSIFTSQSCNTNLVIILTSIPTCNSILPIDKTQKIREDLGDLVLTCPETLGEARKCLKHWIKPFLKFLWIN